MPMDIHDYKAVANYLINIINNYHLLLLLSSVLGRATEIKKTRLWFTDQ